MMWQSIETAPRNKSVEVAVFSFLGSMLWHYADVKFFTDEPQCAFLDDLEEGRRVFWRPLSEMIQQEAA